MPLHRKSVSKLAAELSRTCSRSASTSTAFAIPAGPSRTSSCRSVYGRVIGFETGTRPAAPRAPRVASGARDRRSSAACDRTTTRPRRRRAGDRDVVRRQGALAGRGRWTRAVRGAGGARRPGVDRRRWRRRRQPLVQGARPAAVRADEGRAGAVLRQPRRPGGSVDRLGRRLRRPRHAWEREALHPARRGGSAPTCTNQRPGSGCRTRSRARRARSDELAEVERRVEAEKPPPPPPPGPPS